MVTGIKFPLSKINQFNVSDTQEENVHIMQLQHEEDCRQMLEHAADEREDFLKTVEAEQFHLKTVVYGQEAKTKIELKLNYEAHVKKYDDVASTVSNCFT